MTASNSVWEKFFFATVLALSASGACSQEIQADADGALSEAVSDSSGSGDTTKKVSPSNEDQVPTDIAVFLIGVGLMTPPAALTFGVMSFGALLLLMTTCFVRMSVVFTTRQAIGTVNLPSTQIITSSFVSVSTCDVANLDHRHQAGLSYQAGEISFRKRLNVVCQFVADGLSIEAGNRDTVVISPGTRVSQVDSYDQHLLVLLSAFLVSDLGWPS